MQRCAAAASSAASKAGFFGRVAACRSQPSSAHSLPLLGQGSYVLSTALRERHSRWSRSPPRPHAKARQRRPFPIGDTVLFAIDEISPKFIAVNGLFRLEDRAVANARAAVLKSAKRQISARILRKRCLASDLESSHFPRSIASHETSSEPCSARREAAGIWSKTVAPSMPSST